MHSGLAQVTSAVSRPLLKSVQAFPVLGTTIKGPYRHVSIGGTKSRTAEVRLHRYAAVGKGDTLAVDVLHPKRMGVMSLEDPSDIIKITPAFTTLAELKLGSISYPIRTTEIATLEDLQSYEFLERFHYKSGISVEPAEDDSEEEKPLDSGGRKAVLVCYLRVGTRWQAAGYIELQMPLLMVKPRHLLFNQPFKHPTRPVSWQTWDLEAMRRYVNTVVRIARVVTSPELRGLGLSRILISAAISFAKERWQVKGRRPLFLEISAEMLKYIDFVSSSGLCYIGNTEGNLSRVSKDIGSMLKNPRIIEKVNSGIMSLQKKYLTSLKRKVDVLDRDFEQTLSLIKQVGERPEIVTDLPAEDWYLLKSVLRFPIPYYICGLDETATDYVSSYCSRHSEKAISTTFSINAPGKVHIRGLRISSSFSVPDNPAVRRIMDCFGLEGDHLASQVCGPADIEASAGNIVFISGASGSGKSVLLKALDPAFSSPQLKITKKVEGCYSAGWIREIPEDVPIIQYFGEQWGMERTIAALNQAGLAEAFVYLKPFRLLSRGQRYRVRLADLALREDQVWLIDEFCADLDPLTARIVARNLRRHVLKYRRIAFVAAANYSHFLDALAPTRVICLKHGGTVRTLTYREFKDEYCSADN